MNPQDLPKLTRYTLANALILLTGEVVTVNYKRKSKSVPVGFYYFDLGDLRYASPSLSALWQVLQGNLFGDRPDVQITPIPVDPPNPNKKRSVACANKAPTA